MLSQEKILGALLGTAVGDAMGMPAEGFSHQNIRMYYRGIKGYTDDEKRRDLKAGQWTDDTQFTFALVRAAGQARSIEDVPTLAAWEYVALLPSARRWGPTTKAAVNRLASGTGWQESGESGAPTNGAAMRAAPLGVWWAVSGASLEQAFPALRSIIEITHRHPDSVVAGFGQAYAVKQILQSTPEPFDRETFWLDLIEVTRYASRTLGYGDNSRVTGRLRLLADHLDEFPLDLLDLCEGNGVDVSQSWPFSVAMFVRNPDLLEATLLSSINAGGDTDTTGAMVGALLGACHGWSAFPEAWRTGLENVDALYGEALAFIDNLSARE